MAAASEIRATKRTDAATNTMLHALLSRLGHAVGADGPYVLCEGWADALDDLATALAADEGALLMRLHETDALGRHLLPLLGVVGARYAAGKAGLERSVGALLDVVALFVSPDVEGSDVPAAQLADARVSAQQLFGPAPAPFRAILDVLLGASARLAAAPGGAFLRESPDFYAAQRALAVVRSVLSLGGSYHGKVLAGLRDSCLAAFIGAAAGSVRDARDGRIYAPLAPVLVEIVHCALSPIDPDTAAAAQSMGSAAATEAALQKDARPCVPARHARFGGAVSVRLSTGAEYVLPGARLLGRAGGAPVAAREDDLLDAARRSAVRRKAVSINTAGSNGYSAPDVMAAGDVAAAFLKDAALNELLAVAGTPLITDAAVDDAALWNVLGVASWALRYGRSAGCGPDVAAALDGQLVCAVCAALSREIADGRVSRLPLILFGGVYLREVLRWLDLKRKSASAGDNLSSIAGASTGRSSANIQVDIPQGRDGHQPLSVEMMEVLQETERAVLRESKAVHVIRALFATDALRSATPGMLAVAAEAAYVLLRVSPPESGLWQTMLTPGAAESLARLLFMPPDLPPSAVRHAAFILAGLLRVSRRLSSHASGRSPLFAVRLLDAAHGVICMPGAWRAANRDVVRVCASLGADFVRALYADQTLIVRVFFGHSQRVSAVAEHTDYVDDGEDVSEQDGEEQQPDGFNLDGMPPETRIRLHVRALVEDDDASFAVSYLASQLAAVLAGCLSSDGGDGGPQSHDVAPASGAMRVAWARPRFRALLSVLGLAPSNRKLCVWTLSLAGGDGNAPGESMTVARLEEVLGVLQLALADAVSGPTDVLRPKIPATESADAGMARGGLVAARSKAKKRAKVLFDDSATESDRQSEESHLISPAKRRAAVESGQSDSGSEIALRPMTVHAVKTYGSRKAVKLPRVDDLAEQLDPVHDPDLISRHSDEEEDADDWRTGAHGAVRRGARIGDESDDDSHARGAQVEPATEAAPKRGKRPPLRIDSD